MTNALDGLTKSEYLGGHHIIQSEFRNGAEVNKLYSYKRPPTAAELTYLRNAYVERNAVLTKSALKDAGERYFRGILLASERYGEVTQEGPARLRH